jgi:hypothetical protein
VYIYIYDTIDMKNGMHIYIYIYIYKYICIPERGTEGSYIGGERGCKHDITGQRNGT